MSAEPTETDEKPKKKGGKLPIILALVLVLGGGGFFVMKGKGKKEVKHTIALAEEEVELEPEFLVNMADGRTYLRTKIAIVLSKDFKKEEFEKHKGEVADAINICLKATDPKLTATETDMKKLKRRLAASINKAIGEPKAEEKPEKEEAHGVTKEVDLSKKPAKAEGETPEIPEDWDSLKGPVLKVLFASFATQ